MEADYPTVEVTDADDGFRTGRRIWWFQHSTAEANPCYWWNKTRMLTIGAICFLAVVQNFILGFLIDYAYPLVDLALENEESNRGEPTRPNLGGLFVIDTS